MDIAEQIAQELAADLLGRGYGAMTDEQRMASMETRDRPGPVASTSQAMWMAAKGRHFYIWQAAYEGKDREGNPLQAVVTPIQLSVPEIRAIAMSTLTMHQTIEYAYIRDDHKASLDALVLANVLIATDAAALDDLAVDGRYAISRIDELKIADRVYLRHFVRAREINNAN